MRKFLAIPEPGIKEEENGSWSESGPIPREKLMTSSGKQQPEQLTQKVSKPRTGLGMLRMLKLSGKGFTLIVSVTLWNYLQKEGKRDV